MGAQLLERRTYRKLFAVLSALCGLVVVQFCLERCLERRSFGFRTTTLCGLCLGGGNSLCRVLIVERLLFARLCLGSGEGGVAVLSARVVTLQ